VPAQQRSRRNAALKRGVTTMPLLIAQIFVTGRANLRNGRK